METLDRLLTDEWNEMSEDAAMQDSQSLPLFYSHVTPASQRRSIRDAISNNWHLGNIRDPAPAPSHPCDPIVYRSTSMQLENIGADMHNISQTIACRSAHFMNATTAQIAIATLQPFVVSSMPNAFLARAASLGLPAIGIMTVVGPWFGALTNDIPRHDAAMRADRERAVNATVALAGEPTPAR